MKDFVDDITPINRKNMMAIQGFIGNTITFNNDGSITETNADGETLTITFDDKGLPTERFEGEKIITKNTIFNGNEIREVIL
jgi:YD repeat-containing protein